MPALVRAANPPKPVGERASGCGAAHKEGTAMWVTRVSINNPVFATMVMVGIVVLGVFSYARLRVEQMPDVDPAVRR